MRRRFIDSNGLDVNPAQIRYQAYGFPAENPDVAELLGRNLIGFCDHPATVDNIVGVRRDGRIVHRIDCPLCGLEGVE